MAKVEVTMPKMGESITEGTVIAWHKKPGEQVEADETLLEIGTDKVDTEVPSPATGIVKELLVQEGETVEVGTTLAILETDVEVEAETPPETETPVEEEEPEPIGAEAEETPEPEEEPQEAVAETETEVEEEPLRAEGGRVDVLMPKMGESIVEGTILTWHKKQGDTVEADETLLEIATDKVDTEVPSPASGVVAEILVPEGETVEVGTKIAVIATTTGASAKPEPSKPAPKKEIEPSEVAAPTGDGADTEPVHVAPAPLPRKSDSGRFYSPLVRSIAEAEGLSLDELEQIPGSGRDNRLTKEDVLGYIESRRSRQKTEHKQVEKPAAAQAAPKPAAAPAVAGYQGRVEIVEMDRMRQIIAEHMVRSIQTSAHVTSFAEVDVTNLVQVRERNKKAFEEREGVRLTFTPFFVQAAVEALRAYPIFNASLEDGKILLKKDYHIGIAVAIGQQGLVAPVIRNAESMNLTGLARKAADLAERARNRKLQPDELQGGTFTITNIGSLGSIMGTPIINQPQLAILATGAIKKRPVVIEDPKLGDLIAIRQMMYLSLTYDHRVIDGAAGAAFLQKYVSILESYDPDMIV